jgi:DNA-binding transcriptional LysR family regulator
MTLLAVTTSGTVSGAARELRVTPSQVSKAVARLERQLGVRLLVRRANGVSPTPEAYRMLPRVANAMDELRALTGRGEPGPELELTVAGPSYLLGRVVAHLVQLLPTARIRGLELAPAYLCARVSENVFDVALAPGGIPGRPASWTSDQAGEIRAALFARPAFAKKLAPLPLTPDRVRSLPFIGTATIDGEQFARTGDDCPLAADERRIAHQVQSIGSALEVVANTDHVAFGPVMAAGRLLSAGGVVELPVVGWNVREPLCVVCNGDRVLTRVRAALLSAAKAVSGSETSAAHADPAQLTGRALGH